MKLKISFDKKSILNFFLYHTEKVVFAFFILVFASIIYGAVMRREKFDKVPTQLIEKCTTAQQSLQGERPELVKPLEKTRDYNKDADIYLKISKNGISAERLPMRCRLGRTDFRYKIETIPTHSACRARSSHGCRIRRLFRHRSHGGRSP